ncbi:MAG: radical SAM protein [Candidatus Omnitrophica bacterium]|nr:radical SAM protein [Candidatus Omnitrophota bacterium]
MACDFLSSVTDREFFKRLVAKSERGRLPLIGQWELTCRCNLHCIHCYTDVYNHPQYFPKELQTEEVLRILGELHKGGCLWLTLTGGEIFMRKDFFQIYKVAKDKGFLITLFTNGSLITEEVSDFLKENPPFSVEISLHATSKEIFEKVTQGEGSFQKVLRAINLLLERNLHLVLKVTGLTVNRDEILKIRAFVKGLGNVSFKFGEEIRNRLDGSEDVFEYQLSEKELREIEEKDPQMLREKEIQLREAETYQCESGFFNFHIDAYGMLQLCSGNRMKGYDLRKGSFHDGFYNHLPHFPCRFPKKEFMFKKNGFIPIKAVSSTP